MKNENIAAISTAAGPAGVAVIRISGDSPLSVAEKMFNPSGKVKVKDFVPNVMYAGEILADGFSDFGLCVFFKAPKSFTGEDTVEFHTHGGVAITRGVLRKILSSGARLAENGEFTRRAFMNGKLSLASSEGLIDMINAESESAARAGYSLYRERLTKKVNAMQEELTAALSGIDADMDFPEEGLEETSRKEIKEILEHVISETEDMIATFRIGSALKNGVKVAICGKPNTGKSSLLNALLNCDKAIVSDIAGTTRDVVEGSIDVNGVRFNFYDTAGIRDSEDTIESLGVNLSKKTLKSCDLILFVVESGDFGKEDEEVYSLVKDLNVIKVVNKIDLKDAENEPADVYVSAKTGEGFDLLREKIFDKTVGKCDYEHGDFLCEERHLYALKRAAESLKDAYAVSETADLSVLAIDIRAGWRALGEISGKTADEEIIDDIFKRFCVGK